VISLKGRVALVTGASRGIGRATAELLARAGADVAIGYARDDVAAEETVRELRGLGVHAAAVRADLASWDEGEELVARASELVGPPNILVVNHGVWRGGPIDELTETAARALWDANLTGTFAVCRKAVPAMKRERWGRIVLISSVSAQGGAPGYAAYTAAKGGMIAMTKSLALELAPHGILVNCVAPGVVATDMARELLDNETTRQAVLRSIPLGRVALATEIAGSVLFLASDLATFVCGEILNVNGGSVMCG
jgi:3-oxoacyl-[acyl-carrier protein] reductase